MIRQPVGVVVSIDCWSRYQGALPRRISAPSSIGFRLDLYAGVVGVGRQPAHFDAGLSRARAQGKRLLVGNVAALVALREAEH
jgi:hypothetical protein